MIWPGGLKSRWWLTGVNCRAMIADNLSYRSEEMLWFRSSS
jgi:hypothetical protein